MHVDLPFQRKRHIVLLVVISSRFLRCHNLCKQRRQLPCRLRLLVFFRRVFYWLVARGAQRRSASEYPDGLHWLRSRYRGKCSRYSDRAFRHGEHLPVPGRPVCNHGGRPTGEPLVSDSASVEYRTGSLYIRSRAAALGAPAVTVRDGPAR